MTGNFVVVAPVGTTDGHKIINRPLAAGPRHGDGVLRQDPSNRSATYADRYGEEHRRHADATLQDRFYAIRWPAISINTGTGKVQR